MTPKEVLALIREKEVRAVDLRFMDFPGLWQHFTIPADALTEGVFDDGLGFDGSSSRITRSISNMPAFSSSLRLNGGLPANSSYRSTPSE